MRRSLVLLGALSAAGCGSDFALVPMVAGAKAFVLAVDRGDTVQLWAQDLGAGAPPRQFLVAGDTQVHGLFYDRSLAELAWPSDESAFSRPQSELEPLPSPTAAYRLDVDDDRGPWLQETLEGLPILERAVFPARPSCGRVDARLDAILPLTQYMAASMRKNGEPVLNFYQPGQIQFVDGSELHAVAVEPDIALDCVLEGESGPWWAVGGSRVWRGSLAGDLLTLTPLSTSTVAPMGRCMLWEEHGLPVMAAEDGELISFDASGSHVRMPARGEGFWPVQSILLPNGSRVVLGLGPLIHEPLGQPAGYHVLAPDGVASYFELPGAMGLAPHPTDGAWISTDQGEIFHVGSPTPALNTTLGNLNMARIDAYGAIFFAPDSGPMGYFLDDGTRCELEPIIPTLPSTYFAVPTPTGFLAGALSGITFVAVSPRR